MVGRDAAWEVRRATSCNKIVRNAGSLAWPKRHLPSTYWANRENSPPIDNRALWRILRPWSGNRLAFLEPAWSTFDHRVALPTVRFPGGTSFAALNVHA